MKSYTQYYKLQKQRAAVASWDMKELEYLLYTVFIVFEYLHSLSDYYLLEHEVQWSEEAP